MQYLEFHRFDTAPKICPYSTLMDYITLQRVNHRPINNALFVTTDKGTPAHTDTLRRWAIQILKAAGVDTTR